MKKKLLGVFTSLCAVALITGCTNDITSTEDESSPSSLETSVSVPQSEISSHVSNSESGSSSGNNSTSSPDSSSTSLEPIQDTTITFVSNGGADVDEITAQPGVPVNAPNCAKDGATFVGWYVDNAFTTEYEFAVMPVADLTVFARWIDVENAIILDETSDLQAAINAASETATIFVKPGKYAVNELTINKPLTLLGNNYGLDGNSIERIEETVFHPITADLYNFYYQNTVIYVTSPDVTINGITVDGNNPDVANIWTNDLHESLKETLFEKSEYADQVIANLETFIGIGNDLGIDAGIGIYFGRPGALDEESNPIHPNLSNSTVINSVVKNTSQYGINIYNNRDSKATIDDNATGIEIAHNYIENVWGLTLFSGTPDAPVYAGHYGRAIELLGGATGVIANNVINRCTVGVSIYGNYGVSTLPIEITNNDIIDTNNGIWINSTQVGAAGLVSDNTITITSDLDDIFYSSTTHCAIAITSIAANAPSIVDVKDNIVTGYEIGIRLMGLPANSEFKIAENTFNNVRDSIYVASVFAAYTFLTSSTQLFLFNTNVLNNSGGLKIDTLNPGAVITLVSDDGQEQTTRKIGSLAMPKNFALHQKNQRVTWSAVANSEAYEVYVNDGLVATVTTAYFNFADLSTDFTDDAFTIKVKAVNNTYTELLDSDFTAEINVIRFTKVERVYTSNANDVTTTTKIYTVAGAALSKDNFVVVKTNFEFDGWMNNSDVSEIGVTIAEAGATYATTWFRLYAVSFFGTDNVKIAAINVRVGTTDFSNHYETLGLTVGGSYTWYTNKNRTATYLFDTVNPSGVQKAVSIYFVAN